MNTKALAKRMWDAELRVDQLFFLAASAMNGYLPDGLADFFREESTAVLADMFGEHPEWVDLDDDSSVSEWLAEAGHVGFLAQFATPIMEPTKSGARSFSWGHYRTKWLYAGSLDELMELGFAWARCERAREEKPNGH